MILRSGFFAVLVSSSRFYDFSSFRVDLIATGAELHRAGRRFAIVTDDAAFPEENAA